MNSGTISTSVQHGVGIVSFYHPLSNSFPSDLLDQLAKAFDDFDLNSSVLSIVLKSEGEKTFCAGASFDELLEINDLEAGEKFFSGFAKVINAMRKCSKPIIGQVQGKAVGGGVGLISACDYVFAVDKAAVKLSELSIGIGPFVIEPAVKRKIGVAAMSELSFSATKWFSASWAYDKGLFTELVNSQQVLEDQVQSYAELLTQYSPDALQEMKSVLWKGTEDWDVLLKERASISGRLVLSAFTKKALARFKKK